jgi:hypothetical protein
LIVLSSINFKPDGSFQFHGTLLLPVAQPGGSTLDRGTAVIGVGSMTGARISLTVLGLVAPGARYALKEGSGAMNAETPGAGGKVDFHRSQVLDMWPAEPATYEEEIDPNAPHPSP